MDKKELTLWHNPRCLKSNLALSLLTQADIDGKIKLTIRNYLKDSPNLNELKIVFNYLGFDSPKKWMRQSEGIFKEKKQELDTQDKAQLLKFLEDNPILIERPVVIDFKNKIALIARPIEKIKQLLE